MSPIREGKKWYMMTWTRNQKADELKLKQLTQIARFGG